MIGDSMQSDVKSAEEAGLQGVLLDRRGWCEEDIVKISSLKELKELLNS